MQVLARRGKELVLCSLFINLKKWTYKIFEDTYNLWMSLFHGVSKNRIKRLLSQWVLRESVSHWTRNAGNRQTKRFIQFSGIAHQLLALRSSDIYFVTDLHNYMVISDTDSCRFCVERSERSIMWGHLPNQTSCFWLAFYNVVYTVVLRSKKGGRTHKSLKIAGLDAWASIIDVGGRKRKKVTVFITILMLETYRHGRVQ